MAVAYAITDARPGGTYCSAHNAKAVNAPICSRPTPITSGHSCREGRRRLRRAPSTRKLISAAEPKRQAANQSGLMWASPIFMTGQ